MIWSEIEKNKLKEYINCEIPRKEISVLLNKSIKSIDGQIRRMNLKQEKNTWTQNEKDILQKFYSVEGSSIAKRLPGRNIDSIYRMAQKCKIQYARCNLSINEIGNQYGKLTVLSQVESPIKNRTSAFWLCQCECGQTKVIAGSSLRQGKVNSCGCLRPYIDPTQNFMNRYIRNATSRGIKWELTIEEFTNLTSQPCFYCGQPANHPYHIGFIGNGIDRINSFDAYRIDNVVSCCEMCNYAKSNRSFEDFTSWLKRIRNYQQTLI